MRILLVGISCVGKSTIGKLLAEKWNYHFVDFDLKEILAENPDNVIIAMPPSGLFHEYKSTIDKHPDILTIALKDKAKNIVERLVFYDEDTVLLEDYVVNEGNYDYYYNDVKADIDYFYTTLRKAKLQFNINGMNAEDATRKLAESIHDYVLS